MRLYIPTSSLNADNILSCESIAPASECRRRQFGYSHFDELPELRDFANVTLAFSKIPTFSVNDSDRECFAMVVAIDIEDLEKYQIQAIGNVADTDIFATANPISIPPSTTRLLFSTIEQRNIRSIAVQTVLNANFSIFTNQGLTLLIGTLAEKRYIPI